MMDRWTTWARSMAARHERFTARQGLLVMTLLEPLRMSVSINQRFESFAVAVFPKIRVSIGGILNEIGRRQSASFSLFRKTISLNFENFQNNENSLTPGNSVTRMTLMKERFGYERSAVRDQTVNNEKNEVLIRENRLFDRRVTQSPVLRVFARFEQREQGVMLRKLLFENESQRVIERVTRDHLRVEQRTRGELVMRTQAKPAAVVEDRRQELETQFAATAKTRGPSWPEKPPEINVEQLTEQVIRKIDHRITAYRERLGRAF
jgi:hypothetical protein